MAGPHGGMQRNGAVPRITWKSSGFSNMRAKRNLTDIFRPALSRSSLYCQLALPRSSLYCHPALSKNSLYCHGWVGGWVRGMVEWGRSKLSTQPTDHGWERIQDLIRDVIVSQWRQPCETTGGASITRLGHASASCHSSPRLSSIFSRRSFGQC
jgi:hypothetical protein